MRIPGKYLEHTVIVERLLRVPSKTTGKFAAPIRVSCLVVEKNTLVKDQRVQTTGETRDAEIQSSAQILFQPESRVPLGSRVTIWPGTVNERKVEIVSDAFGQHSIAPSSWQAWTE
jgi:hypothetical protein